MRGRARPPPDGPTGPETDALNPLPHRAAADLAPSLTPPIHLALIGCSSAGKTTLARAVVRACRDLGMEAWLSEDFVARQLRVHWIPSPWVRRRVLELASLLYTAATWRRYRDYHALAFRLIRGSPGSLLYRAGLLRLTLRKTGVHEVLRRRMRDGHVVVSDNEAALQGAHHLFVHPSGMSDLTGVDAFAGLAPAPDIVAYLRTSESEVIERTLRRGHRRLGSLSYAAVERSVRQTVGVFERLSSASSLTDRLLVVDGHRIVDTPSVTSNGNASWPLAARILAAGLEAVRRPPREDVPAIEVDLGPEIVGRLVSRLNGSLPYCHWKGSFPLSHSRDRDRALDLLVDRSSLPRAQAILTEMGFKEAPWRAGPPPSGVRRYLGLDPGSGALCRVHLFTKVPVGTRFIESRHLPLEAMLLENTEALGPLRVPTKAAELVLFVLSTFVQYGSVQDLVRLARKRACLLAEYRWLEARCSVSDALSLLSAHCPTVSDELFLQCLGALHNGESLARRIRLAARVRRLRAYEIRGRLGGAVGSLRLLAAHGLREPSGRGTWPSGGSVIAFVGPDAAGKSTMADGIARWLESAGTVETVHLGKPPSSLWTAPVNGALGVLRAVRGRKPRWKPHALPGTAAPDAPERVGWASLVYGVRAVVLAYDRRRAVHKTRISATRGSVVICDRYPSREVGAMDGPRLPAGAEGREAMAGLYRALARTEGRLYRARPEPDVLIRLTVSVESARQRNRDRVKADKHTDDDLQRRHREKVGEWAVGSDRVWEISTEGSAEETLLAVKRAIWGAL